MTPPPHPGAPQGNTNALKHGFYSRSFRAAISLGVLIRTQQALTLRKESADLADLTAQLNAANRRATALLKLLPPQQSAQNIPAADDPSTRKASCIPTPCETDQNLHREDAKDAKKAETGKGNAALDTQSALSSSRSSRLCGASSFDPLQPQSPNGSELFPPNNSPSQPPPST